MDNLKRLLDIMARLRDPERGCPWDRAQDFASIVPHTLEEAYEVADAIARGDFEDLKSELGDLLFHVVFYAQLARERELFDFEAVTHSLVDKLEHRHPHIFGDAKPASKAEVEAAWEVIKAQERAGQAKGEPSVMDGVAQALPELIRADKLQRRAARVGFDWPDTFEVFCKVEEELTEVHQAITEGEPLARLQEEVGDLLFAVVNLVRHLTIKPEAALRGANAKFERRFRAIESRLKAAERRPEDCSLKELDELWAQVKRDEHR